ncbi:MAG: hypothetical protein JW731_11095 [Bacteroidales bacterium]|nr:hypothetical protein [Bacteroidales bacterium]
MARDFTFKTYTLLLSTLRNLDYEFQTLEDFLLKPKKKVIILRHDSDIWPLNDLKMASIENRFGIKSTYYFRIPWTFNIEIIKKIKDLGHEIGYHYEDLAEAKGNFKKAIVTFKRNLDKLKAIYPVQTVAMHGRPLSKWDSRRLWEKYKLEDFGLIGEPYLSINYNEVIYITDTGSRWDGYKVSIRDSVNSPYQVDARSTFDLINYFKEMNPSKPVLINAHAARWNDNLFLWWYRFFLQHAKNITKKYYKKLIHKNHSIT